MLPTDVFDHLRKEIKQILINDAESQDVYSIKDSTTEKHGVYENGDVAS